MLIMIHWHLSIFLFLHHISMANEEEYILLLPEHFKPLYTNTGHLKSLFYQSSRTSSQVPWRIHIFHVAGLLLLLDQYLDLFLDLL